MTKRSSILIAKPNGEVINTQKKTAVTLENLNKQLFTAQQQYVKYMIEATFDFWLYIIMFAASTVVGYSYASLAMRALTPFLSQLNNFRQLAALLTVIGVGITGALNTLLYWDIETLKKPAF
ncbi:MAG TPA: hypothetical protein QF353_00450 [Gammaproteobacteria bacterium]|nr:hypothetical protein [Gammaproteobacteria bacterium]